MSKAEERIAEVLVQHRLDLPQGGSATGSWCRCSCGEQNYVNSVRDLALVKGRAHVAAEVAKALTTDGFHLFGPAGEDVEW